MIAQLVTGTNNTEDDPAFTNNTEDDEYDQPGVPVKRGREDTSVTDCAIRLVSSLKTAGNIPTSYTSKVISEMGELVQVVMNNVGKEVMQLLDKPDGGDENAVDGQTKRKIQDVLDGSSNPFREVMTDAQQKLYFQKIGALVSPQERLLGKSFQTRIDKKTGNCLQVEENDSFQYIPLIPSLEKYLQKPGVMSAILSEHATSDSNVLCSFRDGDQFKTKYGDKRNIIPLLLYNDEFETTNPLGSKKGKHKVSAF